MHAGQTLSRWLRNRSVIGHTARAIALIRVVQALLIGGRASLTALGRARSGSAHVKHHIKAVDRLLGNQHLHSERDAVYRAIAQSLLAGVKRPVLAIDWSDFECGAGRKWTMIKAAVPVGGRAVVVYARAFPFKRYNSPGAHREFLQALKSVLPVACNPIIVTDAGFRGPWFRMVESLGWDWVGRIRNKIKYLNEQTGRWCFTDSLYKQATPVTRHLGEFRLSPRHGYRFRMYLVRAYAPAKGGRRRPSHGNMNTKLYRRLHRAPWLLATSLPHKKGSERQIKRLYAQRMQIEETFRDAKCHRWGFGLRYARCNNAKRIEILLLLAALAALVLWLIGLAARSLNLARHFQANTERKKPVLSTIFIGRQLIQRQQADLSDSLLKDMFQQLRGLVFQASPA
jgi:hypothetical protein